MSVYHNVVSERGRSPSVMSRSARSGVSVARPMKVLIDLENHSRQSSTTLSVLKLPGGIAADANRKANSGVGLRSTSPRISYLPKDPKPSDRQPAPESFNTKGMAQSLPKANGMHSMFSKAERFKVKPASQTQAPNVVPLSVEDDLNKSTKNSGYGFRSTEGRCGSGKLGSSIVTAKPFRTVARTEAVWQKEVNKKDALAKLGVEALADLKQALGRDSFMALKALAAVDDNVNLLTELLTPLGLAPEDVDAVVAHFSGYRKMAATSTLLGEVKARMVNRHLNNVKRLATKAKQAELEELMAAQEKARNERMEERASSVGSRSGIRPSSAHAGYSPTPTMRSVSPLPTTRGRVLTPRRELSNTARTLDYGGKRSCSTGTNRNDSTPLPMPAAAPPSIISVKENIGLRVHDDSKTFSMFSTPTAEPEQPISVTLKEQCVDVIVEHGLTREKARRVVRHYQSMF